MKNSVPPDLWRLAMCSSHLSKSNHHIYIITHRHQFRVIQNLAEINSAEHSARHCFRKSTVTPHGSASADIIICLASIIGESLVSTEAKPSFRCSKEETCKIFFRINGKIRRQSFIVASKIIKKKWHQAMPYHHYRSIGMRILGWRNLSEWLSMRGDFV